MSRLRARGETESSHDDEEYGLLTPSRSRRTAAVGKASNVSSRQRFRRRAIAAAFGAASLILAGALTWLYRDGAQHGGFVYTMGQCAWKSYASLDGYHKSGRVYTSVSGVFSSAADDADSGFYSQQLPTDKQTKHSYAEGVYDKVMAPYQLLPSVGVLEIGVKKGGSIKLWREYFGDSARIFGSDIDAAVPSFPSDVGIKVLIMDSTDPVAVQQSFGKRPHQLDVIIDDGCHKLTCIRDTFDNMIPLLKETGVYIIEDYPDYYLTHMELSRYWEPETLFGFAPGWKVCTRQDRDPKSFIVVVYPPNSLAPMIGNCVVTNPCTMKPQSCCGRAVLEDSRCHDNIA